MTTDISKADNLDNKNIKQRINVLFISHSSLFRGAEKSLLLLLKNIDQNEIRPVYISPARGPVDEELNRINIKTYNIVYGRWIGGIFPFVKFLFSLPTSIFEIYRIVKKENIDILYTNTMVVIQGGLISRLLKIPHIWHLREILDNNPNLISFIGKKNTHRVILALSDAIIAISNSVAAPFLHAQNKMFIIDNATDFNSLKSSNWHGLNRKGDPQGKKNYIIGVVGDFIERKGQHLALEAFKLINEQLQNTELYFVGRKSGRYFRSILDTVKKYKLEGKVTFTGFVREVEPLMAGFDVTLMPSWEEPFGRVIIESMALGIPVVGTNSGGPAEIIQDGYTGYLVAPGDYNAMAEKAIFLLKNIELKKQMGKRCIDVVTKRFLPEIYVNNITHIVKSIFIRPSGNTHGQ